MNDQYMTAEHVSKIKEECVEISKVIMDSGANILEDRAS